MNDSLFKKNEITRKQAGTIKGGSQTSRENRTIGTRDTVTLAFGIKYDEKFSGDTGTFYDDGSSTIVY